MAVPYASIKLGDHLIADSSFTCIKDGEVLEVLQDQDNAEFYVTCAVGRHFLKGSEDPHGMLIGFSAIDVKPTTKRPVF